MKNAKLLTALVFLLNLASTQGKAQIKSVYDQLAFVNTQWENQPDVPAYLKSGHPKYYITEQRLVQLHLIETEKLLRSRDVSTLSRELRESRLKNLNVLHQYIMTGIFPINTKYINRRPCFIDEKNTYCAVGFLMKESGADVMARDIQRTQNYSYLKDIKHSELVSWVQHSGLTVDELALIQPTYGDCPSAIVEFHYNNTGTDVNEYIEVHQTPGSEPALTLFKTVLFYDGTNTLYKTLTLAQMQSYFSSGGDVVYYYTFPANEDFADAGKIEVRGDGVVSVNQLIEVTTYTSSSVQVQTYYPDFNNPTVRTFNVGESEATPAGNTLTYCGYCANWDLQSLLSTMGTQNPCTVLPIGLSKFYYEVNQNKVNLLWETVSETDNKKFVVQRGSNGVEFEDIGVVPGSVSSNTIKKYSYADNYPGYINYYRLKQVDIDGKYSYSKVLFVKVDKVSPLHVWGNLVDNNLRYQVNLPLSGTVVQVYDITGRCIYTTNAKAGIQSINASYFTTGKYVIRVSTMNGQVYTDQFVKR
jgi:hypothetical protein